MGSPADTPAFDRDVLAAGLAWLAARGVYIGTSSWKYPGWLGSLYHPDRYLTRGKLSNARFERDCLKEHAEVFSTVCVDAGYYRFPSPDWIKRLMDDTPDHYRFTFKMPDDITARTFANLPRHGDRAGKRNEHFLDAALFQMAVLNTLAPYRERCGVLIFEFSHFHPRDFERGRDFVEMLDAFLAALPRGWRYGVEIRNRSLLNGDYFAVLRAHGAAHVFNNWTRMPPVGEQWSLPAALTSDDFTAARFLLTPGRTYEQAVEAFSPYASIKEPDPSARSAMAGMITPNMSDAPTTKRRSTFIYVNNRLEGNSLLTILAVLLRLDLPTDVITPKPKPEAPTTLL